MKKIGGFLGLELSGSNYNIHSESLLLSTGRACLNLIIQKKKIKKLYIPYYICDSIFESIFFNQIKFEYYSINKNFDPDILNLKDGECFYYVNYFGMKNGTIKELIKAYGENLIIDNVQAFYEGGYKNTWSYNSARKFFGVSDGAYLFSPIKIDNNFKRNYNISIKHLINENPRHSYKNFLYNESLLNSNIERVSKISQFILRNINYPEIAKIRSKNFHYLKEHLNHINQFKPSFKNKIVPLCYPLLLDKAIDKKYFFSKNLFIPTFWERNIETFKSGFSFEKELPKKLLPIPIDQRYSLKEMEKIVHIILNFI